MHLIETVLLLLLAVVVSGSIARMTRIGPVYTPPEHRGHGYAAAVTAAATLARSVSLSRITSLPRRRRPRNRRRRRR